MKKIILIIIGLLIVTAGILFYARFRTSRHGYIPKALEDTIAIHMPESTFNIPVSYSVASLQSFLNQIIKGKFLETTIRPLKNEKDEVKVQMDKLNDIELSTGNKEMICVVPLKVTATILKSRLNFLTKGIKPVETQVLLELHTPVSLDANWRLVTHFKLVKKTWLKEPVVRFVGLDFNLTSKLEDYLDKNKEKLTALMDAGINKGVSLEKPVGKVWYDLQKPIVIRKKIPRAYLKFICESIAGNFKLMPDEIYCYTSIRARVAMMTDTTNQPKRLPLPRFKENENIQEYSDVNLYAFTEFDEINEELNHKLKGKIFSAKNMTASIEGLKLYASDSGLTVQVSTKGDIEGDMIAMVRPEFDSINQSIKLKNFQFSLESSSLILNSGDALLHNKIKDTVQSKLALSMDSLILKVPGIIEQAIAKGKVGQTIDVSMKDLKVLSCAIKLGAKRIHFSIHTRFVAAIDLKKLKPGKRLMVIPKKKNSATRK